MLSGAVPHNLHAGSMLWLMCGWHTIRWVKAVPLIWTYPPLYVVSMITTWLANKIIAQCLATHLLLLLLPTWAPTSPFSPNCSFVRWLLSFSRGITSPSSVTQAGSGYWNFSCRPYLPAYFAASFVSDWCPTLSARFSHINFIIGSLFWNNLTAALTSPSLYSLSIEHKPLPPLSHDRYSSDVEPEGCLHPFSTMILQASLSISLSSVIG